MIKEIFRLHAFIRAHPIASQHPVEAWLRWLKWQLGSRLLKVPVIMPWIGSSSLVVERGMTGATGNLYCGLHEFQDMALVLHYFTAGGGLFLDIGANVGSYTILAVKAGQADALCVEPAPLAFARLQRNLRCNDISHRCDARQVVAGGGHGSIRFSTDQDTTNHVVGADYSGSSSEVPVFSVDDLLEGRSAAVWKVDVEGFETQVLSGASSGLSDPAVKVVLLEGDEPVIREQMLQRGFQRHSYDPSTRKLCQVTDRSGYGNNLWVRDAAEVETRLASAPKQTVFGVSF